MKIFLMILCVLTCSLFGQFIGDPYVTVIDDTVRFGVDNMFRNCAVEYEMEVEQNDTSFTFVAVDTVGAWMLCDCMFDVIVDVEGVQPGTYTASFYSYDLSLWDDSLNIFYYDTVYIGDISFTILDTIITQFQILSSQQSPCGGFVSIGKESVPTNHFLVSSYPNPFNNSVTIEFSLPISDEIDITIFNITGKVVDRIDIGNYQSGFHKITWNATNKSSGLYFATITSQSKTITQKLLLLK